MKYVFCGIALLLSFANLWIHTNLRSYLKAHENETVAENEKAITLRINAVTIFLFLLLLTAVLGEAFGV